VNERRRHPRVEADGDVHVSAGGSTRTGRLRDLSVDATLIETEESWPVGTEVEIEMTLDGDTAALQLAGEVIRLAPAEGGLQAMAVLFRDLPPSAATRIDLYLDRQARP
jgi:hypothetical protein